MLEPINMIFTEKYRPKKVGQMVGDFKGKILKYLENPKAIPHFLFYSKTPGTGKTTACKAIINELGCDALILNSSDDRKIDVVREKVKQFAMSKSSKEGLKRAIFMDEADGLTKISQEALRNIFETYAGNIFFMLSCNNLNKIIEPLKSRCVIIPFAYPDKREVATYLEYICQQEKMNYNFNGINTLIELNYPSIRNCVLALQDLYTEKLDVIPENVKPVNALFDEMWKILEEKNWKEIKKIVLQSTLDPRELNLYFWNKFLEAVNIKGIQVCCRNERDFANGADPKVIFVTSLIELVK